MTPRLPSLVLVLLLSGCPVKVEPPTLAVTGGTSDAVVLVELSDVTSAVGLPDLGLLVGRDGALAQVGVLDDEPSPVDSLAEDVVAAAELADGTVLVATDRGIGRLTAGSILPSPLAELGEGGPAQLAADRWGLWIAPQTGGLQRWRDGTLFDVAAAEISLHAPRIAVGPDPAGAEQGGIWIAPGEGVSFLRSVDGGAVEAEIVLDGAPFNDVVVDAGGTVWATGEGGFHSRAPDGLWTRWRTQGADPVLFASAAAPRVWLKDGAAWWVYESRRWTELGGLPEDAIALGIDGRGRMLLLSADGALLSASPRRELLLVGVGADGAVDVPTPLHLIPTGVTAPRSLVAAVDGIDMPVDDGVVTLDPLELGDGVHEIEASAHWRTGEPASASLLFGVGEFETPTWAGEIGPLFDHFCTPCHASAGGAHLLDTRASWEAEFDAILREVEEGAMPLNNGTNPNFEPLGPVEIQMIRAWAAGGFLP
ncbi:MAG: hypothetical protein GY898_01040 [Proteobacteria bacterium]|nr:hypothetical protein [Pseudomonadota bacterium]